MACSSAPWPRRSAPSPGDPRHLGADIGFLAVLHPWGQTLQHHPHLHCVVPGGGLAPDATRWVACRPHFFLPVRVLSRRFRHTFLPLLHRAFSDGKLQCHGQLAGLADPTAWARWLPPLHRAEWVVYARPPCGGPQPVLKYLARYTHRVAIANQRLVSVTDGQVTFRWKDYAHGSRARTMTLDAVEFLRRFLLHRLPRGFHRIRQYGLLGNRHRTTHLARCRALLGQPPGTVERHDAESAADPTPRDGCPQCGTGRLVIVAILAGVGATAPLSRPLPWNTS